MMLLLMKKLPVFMMVAILILCVSDCAVAFGILPVDAAITTIASPSSLLTAISNPASGVLTAYTNTLAAHPLATKMATGAALAVTGDAIAQSHTDNDNNSRYDTRRAFSFAIFDMCYRALQHYLFPIIVQYCHGQYILGALSTVTMISSLQTSTTTTLVSPDFAAATERTLASQLGIVPFLYYPVFFALTGAVQGLDVSAAVDRAKQTFVPLMERNLLFWIPVQFVQFSYVPEDWQIPFLSLCGLCWTIILSIMAGSTKEFSKKEPYCVTGMEGECVIPDDLFPHPTLEEISAEISHDFEEIVHEVELVTHEVLDVLHGDGFVERPSSQVVDEKEKVMEEEEDLVLK